MPQSPRARYCGHRREPLWFPAVPAYSSLTYRRLRLRRREWHDNLQFSAVRPAVHHQFSAKALRLIADGAQTDTAGDGGWRRKHSLGFESHAIILKREH